MSSATLPVIRLACPLLLLPTARLTIPVSNAIGELLLELVQEAEVPPVIAAVPLASAEASTLHEWGTAARIVRVVRPPRSLARDSQRPYLLTLHGLARVRLPEAQNAREKIDGLAERIVEYPNADDDPSAEVAATFKAAAIKLLDRLARDAPNESKRDFYVKLSNMVDEVTTQRAPWLADILISSLNIEYADKLDFLSAVQSDDRLKRATAVFVKQTSISEVSKKIAQSIDESLSKQQKEFFLRQQLSAIQRELRNLDRSVPAASRSGTPDAAERKGSNASSSELDDEDHAEHEEMQDIRVKIEAMAKDSEERKMAVREWRRLRRTPATGIEHGVIRNYLEWLTAVPWPASARTTQTSTSFEALRDRNFLSKARAQLDADHYGLEKIKKRLIEYLAVVRLKELQAEKESHLASLEVEKHEAQAEKQAKQDAEAKTSVDTEAKDDSKALVRVPAPVPKLLTRGKSVKGPILLFVGPPGTGKTSLGQSIARALDRPFQRISLGGVRDEGEIRGHRRTYVASGPGNIVQALRKAGRSDPVILLDEVDKISHGNFHGDPAAALLEVLDPEQNHSFHDHYLNVPVDLSQVLFICTSNTLETIAAPLLDRCEVIYLSGYTYDEKMHIARRFLLPKQLQANGLTEDHLSIGDSTLMHIATHYTREAGVRSLERAIGAVVRYKAVEWAEYCDSIGVDPNILLSDVSVRQAPDSPLRRAYKNVVEEQELEIILGIPRWDEDECEREERRGLVYGLVVTGTGEGGVLPVETIMVPGSGKLKLTGSLGDVIKESGELALSWVKRHAYDLYITKTHAQDPLKNPDPMDVHLHLPSGAVRKDGPSAGIAMTCAFVSLLTGACVPSHIAMTGEVTLRGRVGAVGGIKEKVLGAHRAQITKVILPWANRKDVEHDVPKDVRVNLQIVFVRTIEETLEAAFGKGVIGWRSDVLVESRL
ncbi:ATP-dependent protease La [Daedalea quercina L-15889]|uniref:Lon protease homolog n=1 Tax=Daedalea quercina L-15889 TaxID=1314783 RepID=A0A165LTK1_9APHY|nr:ATP-dependent protease La [Daedalea quercina L-15889]